MTLDKSISIIRWTICIFLMSISLLFSQSSDGECSTCRMRGPGNSNACAPDPVLNDVSDIWGEREMVTIGSRTFRFYNFSESNKTMLQQALSVLPPEYLDALPTNFRVGRPFGLIELDPRPTDRTVGGSHICKRRGRMTEEDRKMFEFITYHPGIFEENTRYVTIFHECGHFIDYKFHVRRELVRDSELLEKLNRYSMEVYNRNLESPMPAESVACGFSYFFARSYSRQGNWIGTRINRPRINRYYPQWLHQEILQHFETNCTP